MRETKGRDWSAYKLALEAGMPKRTVQAYFSDTRDLTSARIDKLCRALGLVLVPKGGR